MTAVKSGTERHRGREVALQLLYQWEIGQRGISDPDPDETELFWKVHQVPNSRKVFASALVKGTLGHLKMIDPLLEESAENWRLERMAVVDRLIMRMAVYELVYTETPQAVIIDEAIELAKTFSGDEAGSFINGVLDRVRRQLGNR